MQLCNFAIICLGACVCSTVSTVTSLYDGEQLRDVHSADCAGETLKTNAVSKYHVVFKKLAYAGNLVFSSVVLLMQCKKDYASVNY